ncbi:MAG: P-loop ATPase, Sll1717 family [Methylococcaceae bacterium]
MNLLDVSFGDRVAENEAKNLSNYFVKTEQWESLQNGDIDIVFGSKGSGKSALYTLLLNQKELLSKKGIILLSAEKPTGKTIFSDINSEPPTSESEFITLWKVYICQLIVNWLMENNLCVGNAEIVANKLIEANLIDGNKNTLPKLLNKAINFAKKLISIDSIEGGLTVEGGITGKITFRSPSDEQEKKGYVSVDDIVSKLAQHLSDNNLYIWILFDRLDVAFYQSLELEKNALKALFKVYRDIEEHINIRLKIFLRDDIWKRITNEGFREASHITRTTSISWSDANLINLIISRALNNIKIINHYSFDKNLILSDYNKQVECYYEMFPEQIDIGEKQSSTFDWIKNRVRDGLNNVTPRELIHFYNESIINEQREQSIGNNSVVEPNLVSRQSIRNATKEVSKVRTEQTIFAEYPELKKYIIGLENSKAEHNITTLSEIWGITERECEDIATRLAEIGLFEYRTAKTEKIYKIPFLYRPYLEISQGKAF